MLQRARAALPEVLHDESGQAGLAHGAGFSLPIPNGFRALTSGGPLDELRKAGGVALAEEKPPALDNPFLGSIVVTPIPQTNFDEKDPAACATVSDQIATVTGTTLRRHGIVKAVWGDTCQFEIAAPKEKPNRGGRGTVARAGSNLWMIMCNFDVRDQTSLNACDAVAAGFKSE